ncbi:hypothetical protein [Burkholderia singularis]|uniref:Transmembrane protein n=1 Tax=Burkholderia singularis TaxID=1503053 RepID=A0A238H3V2_9BURK|nr:hypothetical protein [Burkholderia singularis]SMF99857.1 hypothetical protein BSIN_3044 [Burkholderia singularis]
MNSPVTLASAGAMPAAEWIGLGALALLYLFGIGWASYCAITRARGRGYWLACIALIAAGSAIAYFATSSPAGSDEMPAGFGFGVDVALLGIAGVSAGCAWQTIARLRHKFH